MPDIPEMFSTRLDVIIRPARRDDLRKLEWFGLLTPFRETIERAFDRAEAGEMAFLVAETNDFPAGQVWVDFTKLADEGVAVLWALRVMEPLQNLGIGTRLIAAGERAAHERGLTAVEIGVGKKNLSARRLYERLGYQVVKDEIERWSDTTPDGDSKHIEEHVWILRKRLTGGDS